MGEPYPALGILHITRKTHFLSRDMGRETHFLSQDMGRKTYDKCSYTGGRADTLGV